MKKFVVMSSQCKMPVKCWGRYANVAVVETDGIHMPKQINSSHKSVVSIPFFKSNLFVGTSERCAYRKALRHAEKIAAQLNGDALI